MRRFSWSTAFAKAAGVATLGVSVGCSGGMKDMSFKSDPKLKAPGGMAVTEDIKLAKSVKRKPTAPMLCDFADATLAGKNFRKAEDFYKQALEIDKNCDRAYAGLGRVLGEQERTAAALDILKTGLDRCPKSAAIWNEVGVAKAKRGDLKNATIALRNAVNYEPHNTLYKANLGNMLATVGDSEAAYEYLSQTMTAAEARYRIAGILYSQGHADQSRHQLETALRMDPKNRPAAEMFQAMVGGKPNEEIAALAANAMRDDSDVQQVGYTTPLK